MTQEVTPSQAADPYCVCCCRKLSEHGRKRQCPETTYFIANDRARFEEQTRTATEREVVAKMTDEFNRGVLISVATLINVWGAGTETEHLLKMIEANIEMVERMGFTDYDRDPLLSALSEQKS